MYKVIRSFRDLTDRGYLYNVGDVFPRDGVKVTKERLAELASTKNKAKRILIEKEPAKRKKKESE